MTRAVWREIGADVYVRRHAGLDLNCGLIVGNDRALVVDTGETTARGEELAASVREVTQCEQVVVNTHAHHDHCFGNAAFRDSQIYGHSGAADDLMRTAEHQRSQVVQSLSEADRHSEIADVQATEIVWPFYLIEEEASLDLGGRLVQLGHGGLAHTDHDLVVAVPDAEVVFWGDLVEEGADPAMEDSHPLQWAKTMRRLLSWPHVGAARIAVPGHGAVVDNDFVVAQVEQLGALADVLHGALNDGVTDVESLVSQCHGIGLHESTLRTAAVRALETRATA